MTETWLFKRLEPLTGSAWLLSGWRVPWLRRWVRLTCSHKNQMTWKIIVEADCYNQHGNRIGHVNSLVLKGCERCNKVFYVYDYRA